MRTRFALALLGLGLLGACSIEPINFTPLADDEPPQPDASEQDDCGDGTREDPEACDGLDLAGADCTSAGAFTGGTLGCDENCAFDTSSCETAPTVPQLRLPMNNAYVGATSISGSLRPTFTWEASTALGGETVTYELQFSADATFSAGVTTVSTTTTSHRPAADLLVSMTAPVGTRYYWRVVACAAGLCSASSSAWRVSLGRSDRDLNGDGFADVLVAASDAGGTNAGRVLVFFGSGGTFDTIADGTIAGAASGDAFGNSVAYAGDVNGDGFIDVVVGASGNDSGGSSSGRAYVYLGGPGGTFNTVADGTISGPGVDHRLGVELASAGDVNGDGFADLVIAASTPERGFSVGRAELFFGGPGGTFDTTSDGTLLGDGDFLQGPVTSAGDINGDGFADVAAAAYGEDAVSCGRVHLYLGGPGAAFEPTSDATLHGALQCDGFGEALACAGDVNADGFADVVIGAERSYAGGLQELGRAHVYFGGVDAFDIVADGVLTGAAPSDSFGEWVATGNDINGDGFDDVLISAPRNDASGMDSGRVYVYYGGAGAVLDASADGVLSGAAAADFFGGSAGGAGDLNGDGFEDAVVGAIGNDDGGDSAGRAYVYFGRAGASLDATADAQFTGAAALDRFGRVAR